MSEQVTVALAPEARQALDAVAGLLGLGRDDVAGRALLLYAFVRFEMAAGGEFLLRSGDGAVSPVRIAEDAA